MNYNGLMLIFSGYGTENSFICSNGEYLKCTEILKLFNNNKKFNFLPKLLISDVYMDYDNDNDNKEQKENETKETEKETNSEKLESIYSMIITGNKKCNNIWRGQIIKNFCDILFQIENGMKLIDILNIIKKNLLKLLIKQPLIVLKDNEEIENIIISKNNRNQNANNIKLNDLILISPNSQK